MLTDYLVIIIISPICVLLLYLLYYFFLTISVSLLFRLPLGGFSPFGSAMAVDERSDFRIFKGRCHGSQLFCLKFRFFRNSKTTRDRHMSSENKM